MADGVICQMTLSARTKFVTDDRMDSTCSRQTKQRIGLVHRWAHPRNTSIHDPSMLSSSKPDRTAPAMEVQMVRAPMVLSAMALGRSKICMAALGPQ